MTSKTLGRYVESKPYQKIFDKIIEPLKVEHLQALLAALYPNDKDNSQKLRLILGYKKDLA